MENPKREQKEKKKKKKKEEKKEKKEQNKERSIIFSPYVLSLCVSEPGLVNALPETKPFQQAGQATCSHVGVPRRHPARCEEQPCKTRSDSS